MLKGLKKIVENKALRIIGKIIYYILFLIILLVLVVIVMQRLTNNNIAIGGIRIFNILTESMVPKYEVGDVLISKTVEPSEIKVGDDISYIGEKDSFAGKVVTHQVIQIEENNGEYVFHTKGLANDVEDPTITANQIYGVVIYKVQSLSLISKIVNDNYGFFFIIFIPLTVLIAVKIKDIYSEISERREEKEDKEEKEKEEEDKNKDKDKKKENTEEIEDNEEQENKKDDNK